MVTQNLKYFLARNLREGVAIFDLGLGNNGRAVGSSAVEAVLAHRAVPGGGERVGRRGGGKWELLRFYKRPWPLGF